MDDVSLDIRRGEILGLVGESGCGKSTLGKALMRLHTGPASITAGELWFDGRNLMDTFRSRDARYPGGGDRDGFPGSDDLAQPGPAHSRPSN